jgi:hypothetical protein
MFKGQDCPWQWSGSPRSKAPGQSGEKALAKSSKNRKDRQSTRRWESCQNRCCVSKKGASIGTTVQCNLVQIVLLIAPTDADDFAATYGEFFTGISEPLCSAFVLTPLLAPVFCHVL